MYLRSLSSHPFLSGRWFDVLQKVSTQLKTNLTSVAKNRADKNAIHSHIRLFEPLVIKALKQYTTTTSVQLQKQVLDLLAQLVQLRVNYCLLDSDQVCHFCLLSAEPVHNLVKIISKKL